MLTLTLPVAVYRFFDADDRLLYVGVTESLGTRFGAHSNSSAWWPRAVRNTIEWYDTRNEALRAECEAIVDERPLYNVADAPFIAPAEDEAAAMPRFLPGPPKKRRQKGTGCIHYRANKDLWVAKINFGWMPTGRQDIREKTSRDRAVVEKWLEDVIAETKGREWKP